MLTHNFIDKKDMQSYLITDSIDETIEYINQAGFNEN